MPTSALFLDPSFLLLAEFAPALLGVNEDIIWVS
jgi:hypothetical protein